MIDIRTTPEFDVWLRDLRDGLSQRRLLARLRKASMGLLGDVQPVGGGDKASQGKDIAKALQLAQQLELDK